MICKQLGYKTYTSYDYGPYQSPVRFGIANMNQPIWLTNLDCKSTDININNCSKSLFGNTTSCSHSNDIYVSCITDMPTLSPTRSPIYATNYETDIYPSNNEEISKTIQIRSTKYYTNDNEQFIIFNIKGNNKCQYPSLSLIYQTIDYDNSINNDKYLSIYYIDQNNNNKELLFRKCSYPMTSCNTFKSCLISDNFNKFNLTKNITNLLNGTNIKFKIKVGYWVYKSCNGLSLNANITLHCFINSQSPTPQPTPLPIYINGTFNGDLRIVDGINYYTGRLEIFYNGVWGMYCIILSI